MTAAYIRETYGVPAKRGGRIAYTGDTTKGRQEGTITSFRGPYVRLRLDGEKHAIPFHPTWELEYLPKAQWTLTEDNLWDVLDDTDKHGIFAKPHYGPAQPGQMVSMEIDGLTIRPHGERIWVRFGDTITVDQLGQWAVTRPADAMQGA